MLYHEEKIQKHYEEQSNGIPKNRRLNGISVKYKQKDTTVYFYIKGAKYVKVAPKFETSVRRIFEQRLLHKELQHCDFAQTSIENDSCYKLVEWSNNLRLRQAIPRYGRIKRAMKIEITKEMHTEYVFHVLLEELK